MWQKIKRYAGLCALIIISISAQVGAQVPCEYDVTIIQAPTDCGILGTVNTFGLGLNESGSVVGYYKCPVWDHNEAFVWTAEKGFVTLDRPEGVYSASAVDINDNGIICGTAWMFGLGQRGFVYEEGKWTILDPVVPDGGWSGANAINNDGVVVGQRSITKNLNPQVAYMWSEKDGFIHLDGLEKLSSATAIKGNIITGWTANSGEMKDGFLWDNGKVSLLGPIPNGLSSAPAAVTSQGVIVGSGAIPMDGYQFGIPLAFLWNDSQFTIIGTLPEHLLSHAFDVSSKQHVVGVSWIVDDNPNISHGFLWVKGCMQNLDDLLPLMSGVSTRSAGAISSKGKIVADGTDSENNAVVVLLTPRESPLGDLDGDCSVGLSDLILLLNNWGVCEKCNKCAGDLNGDCTVNTSDLLNLFVNWSET